jgi:hypothetical protein
MVRHRRHHQPKVRAARIASHGAGDQGSVPPITEEGEKPFAMMQDLWSKHRDWVFEPIYYSSVNALIASLDEKIIRPAEARFVELVRRKGETMAGEHV